MTRELNGPRRAAAAGEADSLAILLHGYGANGDDLFGLAEPLSQILPGTAFSAPNAPERCALSPLGYQWFPIPWIDGSSEAAMKAGFVAAKADLHAFIDAELARLGLGADRLALIGFSQGTMMSLAVGPAREETLAGIVGFSGRVADEADFKASLKSRPPALLVHGDRDDVIPVAALDETRRILGEAGIAVRWHVSRGVGHGIAPDGLTLAAEFLHERLALPN